MGFDWFAFLDLAELLGDSQNTHSVHLEAERRSSISRAYYAAFCGLRDYCKRNLGYSSSASSSDHKELRDFLKTVGYSRLASLLHDLRVSRNNADYDAVVTNLNLMRNRSLKRARKIRSFVETGRLP